MRLPKLLSGLLCALTLMPVLAPADTNGDQWHFRVWLDDKEIGSHTFDLVPQEQGYTLHSHADFTYRLWFITAYRYLHSDQESWLDGCLQTLNSETDDNGDDYTVQGQLKAGGFVVNNHEGQLELPDCVMSFAYWNPQFLKQQQLLNSQNGEWLDIEVGAPVEVALEVRGEMRSARRYRLQAGDLVIRLWYSEADEWLALESDARGGRVLRYELL